MASKKTVHSLNKFIINTRIDYLLRLYNSQPLREYLIAEAENEDESTVGEHQEFGYKSDDTQTEDPSDDASVESETGQMIEGRWINEKKRAAENIRMARVTKRSEDGVQALASTICRHFEAVNGKPTSKVRIPISSHSDFFEIASDGLMVGGCSENIRMTRVVMEPAFPILVTLYDSVMGLVEDKNATRKHIEEWLPLRRSGILKELKIHDLLGRNMILLSIPDMEKPPFFTLFEWAYDLMKGFSPISTKDQFFDDRIGIPYAQLLLQPACLGLAYIVDHHLPIKRCQRESCNRVFRTTTRQQRYCSPKCKSAVKYEKRSNIS